jgi:hypothetical protein
MKYHKLFGALVVCGLMVAVAPARAHHAVHAQYDFEKPVDFEGVLIKMEWINPHSMIHLERTNADGTKTVWLFQTTGPALLRQRGLARGLEVGKTYTASGFAARNGNPMGFLKTLKMPDGRIVTMWFGDPNGN